MKSSFLVNVFRGKELKAEHTKKKKSRKEPADSTVASTTQKIIQNMIWNCGVTVLYFLLSYFTSALQDSPQPDIQFVL